MVAIIFFTSIGLVISFGVYISAWLYRNGAIDRQVTEYW
jgi:hypothetical protein